MPVLDLSAYKPVPGTLEDANQIANGFTAIQTCINGLDNNNFAAGKIFDPAKLMQDAAVDGDALVWDNTNLKWVPASAMPVASVKPGLYKLWDSTDAGVSFPAASITTPTLPQTFKHLRVQIVGQSNSAVANTTVQMRMNGDTGANYYDGGVQAGTGTPAANLSDIAVTAFVLGFVPGGTVGGANVASWDICIYNYASAVAMKGVTSSGGGTSGAASMLSRVVAGEWTGTAAITTLTFFLGGGSFVGGVSRITVYGEA